jgi:preprotein translocase subunit SecA
LNFSKTYKYSISFLYNQFIIFEKKNQLIENLIVKNSGGLYVIGTERNDSRRIDNQLRGRCGRQGDPGKSRFFLSIDDNLLRRFGGSDIQSFMQTQLIEDNDPIESNLLTKSLDAAQKRVEEQSYDARKYLFDYDEVLDKQRKVVYYERRQILESNSIQTRIIAYGEQVISEIVNELLEKTIDNKELITLLENLFGTKLTLNLISKFNLNYSNFDPLELEIYLFQEFWLAYEAKSLELEIMFPGVARSVERFIILRYLDISWTEHLQKVSLLRDAVGWRGYGQRNPLFEYREEAYYLFQAISQTTRTLVLYDLLRAETDVL